VSAVYITTPIYYVNGAPHIGHADTATLADAIARFARLTGRRAHLVTGTDEHGLKVEQSAAARGIPPQRTVLMGFSQGCTLKVRASNNDTFAT
jgi:methionyl-tRNA synthetase